MVTGQPCEKALEELLDRLSGTVDIELCREKDARYMRTFAYKQVDRPPLVAILNNITTRTFPAPWDRFQFYSYREAFDNPPAMMHNMLLERALPGLLLGDDSPSAIRNNHGTIQMAGYLGGNWELHGNDYPWVRPFRSIDKMEEIAGDGFELDIRRGVLSKSIETLDYFKSKLKDYPVLDRTIQISMPDLQGPFDTAEQLWGSEIFYSFYDEPDLLRRLLMRIVDATADVAEVFRQHTNDRMDPAANAQHEYAIPGRLMIRNDSSIMLSPDIYREHVKPFDADLLKRVGKGTIHFCGNGQHLVKTMLEIPDLLGLDFGNPESLDIGLIQGMCRDRKVSMTNIIRTREDLISGKARGNFPTGVVFTYYTDSFEDAKDVVQRYKKN